MSPVADKQRASLRKQSGQVLGFCAKTISSTCGVQVEEMVLAQVQHQCAQFLSSQATPNRLPERIALANTNRLSRMRRLHVNHRKDFDSLVFPIESSKVKQRRKILRAQRLLGPVFLHMAAGQHSLSFPPIAPVLIVCKYGYR